MRPELQRTIFSAGRTALEGFGSLFVVSATFGTAYIAGYCADELGFGLSPIIAMSVIGFCLGWAASAAIYRWFQIKLSPPPLHTAELFNETGSR